MQFKFLKRKKWRFFFLLCIVLSSFIVVIRLIPHQSLKDMADNSRIVKSSDGTLLRLTLSSDQNYRLWRSNKAIAPTMIDALFLKEDRYFYYHFGVNPIALVRASIATYIGGDRQGGSTLTMQLARRVYGINSRKVTGKIKQVFAALWLEIRYSKAEILEAYLNFAPMGGNIEGIEAASQIYFHKKAQDLSLSESLALAVIPQSPTKRAKFGQDLHTARLRLQKDWINEYPNDPRIISLSNLTLQFFQRKDLPFLAPHYTDYVLKKSQESILNGTLDIKLQKNLETILHNYIRDRSRRGIVNASALLVDTRDMEIKAMIGSADFFSTPIHGQVNGTTSKRSPGSTLKPFLYALAIDQGVIHPMTILKDAPTMFGYFQPENFDGRFIGPLAAQDALIKSRNIPAVFLASQTRRPTLYQFLVQAKIQGLRPEESYGLSIALGGGEMKMTELATLYSLLRRDGKYRPLRYLKDQILTDGDQLISPEAAFITRDMLQHNPRPKGLPIDFRKKNWPVGWKTGTSWSYHDAWTAGFIGPYVLIVWTGNFDNKGSTAFIGIQTAAPLFFRIADAMPLLRSHEKIVSESVPKNVKRIEICSASGDLPNQWCEQKAKTWFIPGVSPIKVSTLHRPIFIDKLTGKRACPPFDPKTMKLEIYEYWPSDIKTLFLKAGLPRRVPPPANSNCLKSVNLKSSGLPPKIKMPSAQVSYVLSARNNQSTISLLADTDSDAKKLYWFDGNKLLGQSKPSEVMEWLPTQSGAKQLFVIDDHGRTSKRYINIILEP